MSVQTMQPVNEQSAIMPAIDTNVQKNAIANEQILANIDCPQENNTTSQKPETVKPLQAAQNVQIVETQVQTDDVPQIDTQTLKNIQNTAENATGQISTAIDESQTTTTATDSAIKESKIDNVQTDWLLFSVPVCGVAVSSFTSCVFALCVSFVFFVSLA